MIESALQYLALGLHPIPLESRGKRSLVKWRSYQEAPPTQEQVEAWWRLTPDANIGLVLGRGVFAVDVDGPLAYELLNKRVTIPPEAPVVKTGKGYHIYFKTDKDVPDKVALLKEGTSQVDIRGVGYVVAPPSLHSSGAVYKWLRPLRMDMPPAPPELLALIFNGNGKRPDSSPQWYLEALKGTSQGERDVTCTRLAGYLLRQQLPVAAVKQILYLVAEKCVGETPFGPKDIDKIVESIARREALAGEAQECLPVHVHEVALQAWDDMHKGRRGLCRTPLPQLNFLLHGGFAPQDLIYLGARASVGKTALALQIAYQAAHSGLATLFITLERGKTAIFRRVIAQNQRISLSNLWDVRGDEKRDLRNRIVEFIDTTPNLPLWFSDEASALSSIQKMVADFPVPLGFLVIDHLQLVYVPKVDKRERIEETSRQLKKIAQTYKIPVLCMSTLRRPHDRKNWKPSMDDLRESGELEHDADVVFFLHRERGALEAECIIDKNRDGMTGNFALKFTPDFVAFAELAEGEKDEKAAGNVDSGGSKMAVGPPGANGCSQKGSQDKGAGREEDTGFLF